MTQLLEDLYKSKIQYGEVDRLMWVPSQQKGIHVKLMHRGWGAVNHTFLGKVYGKLMCPDGGFLLVVCGIWRVSTNK